MAVCAQQIQLVPSADDSSRMDTIVFSEPGDADAATAEYPVHSYSLFADGVSDESTAATLVIIFLIIICGLPLFIVIITLWFSYKNKQAKYKLAAEALAAGQSIPKELFSESDPSQKILSKGIKNLFLGIGLGVFLWVMTGQAGLAAIGFLIFCMGLGQVLIAYTTRRKKEDKE